MASPPNPRVGVGVFVFSDSHPGQFLMGRRKGSHGAGTWALPGGHLEFCESFAECATRETLEETGLRVTDVQLLTATNDVWPDGSKHYITIFVRATVDGKDDTPRVMEPDKCEGWEWKSAEELREACESQGQGDTKMELFLPMIDLFRQQKDAFALLQSAAA